MKTESLVQLYLEMLRKGELPKDPHKVNEDQKIQLRAEILKKKWWKEDQVSK